MVKCTMLLNHRKTISGWWLCNEYLLREIPKENWGIRGGQAGCDVELDFKIEV